MNIRLQPFIRRILLTLLPAVLLLCTLNACGAKKQNRVVIGYQNGVAYAPLLIMKEHGLLADRLPDTEIEWQQFNGPTPIREAMVNGSVTFGFMGISPVLIGIDNGMPWKYFTGLSSNRVALVANRPDFKTLHDLKPEERIAVLSPGCTQHVLLSMLAKKQLGDARLLDTQLVSLSHPDAMNALLSGTEIALHVTTPPYLEEELRQGMVLVAEGEDIMGEPFTFICGVAMTDYVAQNEETALAFREALSEAIAYINANTKDACKELAPFFDTDADTLYEQMTYHGTIYGTELNGIPAMSLAMRETGFIETVPDSTDLFFFPPDGDAP